MVGGVCLYLFPLRIACKKGKGSGGQIACKNGYIINGGPLSQIIFTPGIFQVFP